MAASPTPRWRDGLYIADGSIVGTVAKLAPGRWSERWCASGCSHDWEDVPLGQYDSEAEAKRRVEDWVERFAS